MFNKEDILNNVGIIGQSHYLFICLYCGSQWVPTPVWLSTFLHITNNMCSAEKYIYAALEQPEGE